MASHSAPVDGSLVSDRSEPPISLGHEIARRPPWPLWAVATLIVSLSSWCFCRVNLSTIQDLGPWLPVYLVKLGIELIASSFATFYLLVAACYRPPGNSQPPQVFKNIADRLAVAYLCCDDLDENALHSLVDFCARTGTRLVIHDDSKSEENRSFVDQVGSEINKRYPRVQILRRPDRSGGKPGAVNNLVKHLAPEIRYLLLCDSDSLLLDQDLLEHTLAMFDDPQVALVQFRNTGSRSLSDPPTYQRLTESSDFYDAVVSFIDEFGWSPFLGHNAVIRLSAFHAVGGFTPGQLADDIDFSAKLRLAGHKILYARPVRCGERHPHTHEALRRRTAKWAYGCTQVLLRWAKPIITSPILTVSEKVSFFLTVGYYHFQSLLLLYLTIFYLVLPFEHSRPIAMRSLLMSASLILLLTFFPSITYFARNGTIKDWPQTAACWGLTYGSQDFIIVKAIIRCLLRKTMPWVPTNRQDNTPSASSFAYEVCFGLLILAVALARRPVLLILPTTALFAGKFLLTPWLDKWIFKEKTPAPSPLLRR